MEFVGTRLQSVFSKEVQKQKKDCRVARGHGDYHRLLSLETVDLSIRIWPL